MTARQSVRRVFTGALALGLPALLSPQPAGAAAPGAADKQECATAFVKGQELQKAGKLIDSRSALVTCGRELCPAVVRKDCLELLQSVETSLPTIVPGARDGEGNDIVEAKVSLDGSVLATRLDGMPIAVDPGAHTLRFERAGAPALERQVVIRVGEKNRVITVDLVGSKGTGTAVATGAPAPSGSGPAEAPEVPSGKKALPIGAFVVGGLGLAAVGVFAGLAITGKGELDNLRETCGKTQSCKQSDVDAVKVQLIAGDISLGVGALAVGAAVIWLIASQRGGAPAPNAAMLVPVAAPVPGGMTGGFVGRF